VEVLWWNALVDVVNLDGQHHGGAAAAADRRHVDAVVAGPGPRVSDHTVGRYQSLRRPA